MIQRRKAVAAAMLAVTATAAACGGSGNSRTSSGGSSYDPATSTLNAAGLQVCSQAQRVVPSGLGGTGSGVAATRGFYVAKDCKGKTTSPNTVVVAQFTSQASLDAGKAAVSKALPRSEVATAGPVLIVVSGPDATANMAAIKTQAAKRGLKTVTTTTSS
jgi:hypothetical protein